MDLLKDITREFRGSADRTRRTDRSRSQASSAPRSGPSETATERERTEATDQRRDDEHVCPFCQTEFEASRGACPECDAEIVLRGER